MVLPCTSELSRSNQKGFHEFDDPLKADLWHWHIEIQQDVCDVSYLNMLVTIILHIYIYYSIHIIQYNTYIQLYIHTTIHTLHYITSHHIQYITSHYIHT